MSGFSWLRPAALLTAGLAVAMPSASALGEGYPVKPLLWKIEGKTLTKPSYLFGTIHISTPAIRNLHPTAEKAFTSADALFAEIPMDSKSQLDLAPLVMRNDGKTLGESIGKELSASLDSELKLINPQFDLTPFQPMKTWVMSVTMPVLKLQLEGSKAIDTLLWERATAAGQKTGSLETAASQFEMLDSFEESEDVIILSETLKQIKEERAEGVSGINNLIAAYTSGDEKQVIAETNRNLARMAKSEHKELGERFMRKLIDDRNITMAKTVDEELVKSPDRINFFAVGTLHLIGPKNIGERLTAKGYTLTRIED